MTCDHLPNVIVCRGPAQSSKEATMRCGTCHRKTTFCVDAAVGPMEDFYGPTFTCMSCGEMWDWDGRRERPFAPGWRKANKDAARRRLDRSNNPPRAATE